MTKWQEVRGIKTDNYVSLVSAGCRYLNNCKFPTIEELASIIGLEKVEINEEKEEGEEEYEKSCEDDE